LHVPESPLPPPPEAGPIVQMTPASTGVTVAPHSGGSDGAPVHATHLPALHAGGGAPGQGHTLVAIGATSALYCASPETLMAAPPLQRHPPAQIVPVAMGTQSEFRTQVWSKAAGLISTHEGVTPPEDDPDELPEDVLE
jgi:hypothetical protein